jgi:hypothetical protein
MKDKMSGPATPEEGETVQTLTFSQSTPEMANCPPL